MRSLCILVIILIATPASAQPVSFELRGDVPVGQKPVLRVTAVQPVTDLRVELKRDDGKDFTLRQAALAKGCASTALAVNMHHYLVLANTYRWRHGAAPAEGLLKRVANDGIIREG